MACPCETYDPICVDVNPCNAGTWLGITPNTGASGTWTGEIFFNGAKTKFGVEVEVDSEISILTELLNENYVHEFRLYNTVDELFGCYKLHTTYTRNVANAPVPPVEEGEWDWHSIVINTATNTVTSDYFTGEISPIIWLAGSPMDWAANSISHDPETGVMDFTAIGGLDGSGQPFNLSFQYRNLNV